MLAINLEGRKTYGGDCPSSRNMLVHARSRRARFTRGPLQRSTVALDEDFTLPASKVRSGLASSSRRRASGLRSSRARGLQPASDAPRVHPWALIRFLPEEGIKASWRSQRMADPVPCPQCARANAAHRPTCLYCGTVMPSPQPKPVAAARAPLPTDLDALVREALSGGDISKLRSAMTKASTEPGSSGSTPDATPPPAATRAPRPVPLSRPVAPRPPVGAPPPVPVSEPSLNGQASVATASRPHRPLNPTAPLVMEASAGVAGALHEVAAAVQSALAVQQNGEPIHPSLDAIQQALDHARALAPPPPDPTVEALLEPLHPTPGAPPLLVPLPDDPPIPLPVAPARERPPVLLPKYRRRWLLVIQGPGDAELTQPMARALGVDGVSARFAAIARAPRVVLRRDTPDDLRQAAVQVQKLGVAAVVVSRDELESIASPDLVLASDGDARLSVSAGWPWDADLPDSLPQTPGAAAVRHGRCGAGRSRCGGTASGATRSGTPQQRSCAWPTSAASR